MSVRAHTQIRHERTNEKRTAECHAHAAAAAVVIVVVALLVGFQTQAAAAPGIVAAAALGRKTGRAAHHLLLVERPIFLHEDVQQPVAERCDLVVLRVPHQAKIHHLRQRNRDEAVAGVPDANAAVRALVLFDRDRVGRFVVHGIKLADGAVDIERVVNAAVGRLLEAARLVAVNRVVGRSYAAALLVAQLLVVIVAVAALVRAMKPIVFFLVTL